MCIGCRAASALVSGHRAAHSLCVGCRTSSSWYHVPIRVSVWYPVPDRATPSYRVPIRVHFVSAAEQDPSCMAGGEPCLWPNCVRFVSGTGPRPLCIGCRTDSTLFRDGGQRVRFVSWVANCVRYGIRAPSIASAWCQDAKPRLRCYWGGEQPVHFLYHGCQPAIMFYRGYRTASALNPCTEQRVRLVSGADRRPRCAECPTVSLIHVWCRAAPASCRGARSRRV